jgi:hypothetical protein
MAKDFSPAAEFFGFSGLLYGLPEERRKLSILIGFTCEQIGATVLLTLDQTFRPDQPKNSAASEKQKTEVPYKIFSKVLILLNFTDYFSRQRE